MNIELKLTKKLFSPKLYPLLLDYSHRWEIYLGSAGSGKSYFIVQKLVIRACTEKIRILVCRKYGTTIRQTVFALFKEILDSWKLTPYVTIRETDFNIRFPNNSEIIFTGLDEEQKLLSLTNIGTVFIEEAFEVDKDLVEQLNLRMRGTNQNQQIIMAFNPISKNHWLYDFCEVNPPESFCFSKTTYKDNPFLSPEYVKSLEDLRLRNPSKYRIYGLGEWGNDPEGLVLTNWEEDYQILPELLKNPRLEHLAGLDFGYIDPTAVIEALYDKENGTIYVINEFFKSRCQLDEVVSTIGKMGLTKTRIWCDSAEPRSIDFLKSKGILAVPCIKGPGSVQARIAFLQNSKIVLAGQVPNFKEELENFSYIKKNGEYTNDTTHEYSHLIDALGYAFSNIYTKSRLRTMDKSILGL